LWKGTQVLGVHFFLIHLHVSTGGGSKRLPFVSGSSVLRINICCEARHLCQARNRCVAFWRDGATD